MSYARWGCDGSEVYVFMACTGGFICQWNEEVNFKTGDEMAAYLLGLKHCGVSVPDYAIEGLKGEVNES